MSPKVILYLILFPILCFSREYPDVGGVLDFSNPENISNHIFILTNPKSGSHLLLYSIMKITGRPLRGRVPYWHFENDPPFFEPENLMGYPLDFSKPTTYWGHEYHILSSLNQNNNKLIFILRDYRENISSILSIKHKNDKEFDLDRCFLHEILHEGEVFREYILRLQLYDSWDPENKSLVFFEDLLFHPELFVPQVLSFIGDDSEYGEFVDHYDEFKIELSEQYDRKQNRTGSGSDTTYFSRKISKETLEITDDYLRQHYPYFWVHYLAKPN